MKVLTYAPDALQLLNGFFCIYKPAGLYAVQVRETLKYNLSRDLNCMETRPPRDFVLIEGTVASKKSLSVTIKPSFADHTLVVGPRYKPQDFRLRWINFVGHRTSGVMVMAVNDGCRKAKTFQGRNFLRTVELKCQFGFATSTFMSDGKVLEKTTYAHIRQGALDRILASIQATHQALAFKYSGVPIESQEAYNLASRGIIRPSGISPPIIYNIRCTEFNLPYFTLEMQCINETEDYLTELIHEIGIYLRSCAVCCQLRQTQFGHFMLDHALLQKHWTLEHIASNIMLCKDMSSMDILSSPTSHFQPIKISEVKEAELSMQEKMRADLI